LLLQQLPKSVAAAELGTGAMADTVTFAPDLPKLAVPRSPSASLLPPPSPTARKPGLGIKLSPKFSPDGNVTQFSAVEQALRSRSTRFADDDILVEDDALLLENFLDVLRESNGDEVASCVENCYTYSAEYNNTNSTTELQKLKDLIAMLSPGDSITVASAFSHMLTLGNIAGKWIASLWLPVHFLYSVINVVLLCCSYALSLVANCSISILTFLQIVLCNWPRSRCAERFSMLSSNFEGLHWPIVAYNSV
jgi:hypothetical protein